MTQKFEISLGFSSVNTTTTEYIGQNRVTSIEFDKKKEQARATLYV